MNISIFGTGYVGLVTGACLAESGHEVYCIDVDKDKIDLLNSGQIPIHEPGLKALVASNLAAERIHFSTNPEMAIKKIEENFTDAKHDKTDGLKLTWKDSWVHIRKSNTEPIIRIYAEASSEDKVHKLVDSVKRCIL